MHKPLRAAIIGLGGFARMHHESILELQAAGEVELVATCDSQLSRFAGTEIVADIERRSVAVYEDYLEMLDAHRDELDFVTIPTPIPLHAPMHRACVERGLATYLEKPPTLDFRELESMIATEKAALQSGILGFESQVGFNFIVESERQKLKARLLAGEFGVLKRAGMTGHWPRADTYFERAGWAGRLRVGDNLILDSCAGNALAHYVHNLLFWCGEGEILSWGEVQSVEAELYRAHNIESFDTVFARAQSGATEILLGATHAGRGDSWQREWFECERARVIYGAHGGGYEILWTDGRRETGTTSSAPTAEFLTMNLRHFARYLSGETGAVRPLTTLADSRPFVELNDLLFIAARAIHDVSDSFLERESDARGHTLLAIEGIEAALHQFASDARLPSESGLDWGKSGGRATRQELPQLESVIAAMSAAK